MRAFYCVFAGIEIFPKLASLPRFGLQKRGGGKRQEKWAGGVCVWGHYVCASALNLTVSKSAKCCQSLSLTLSVSPSCSALGISFFVSPSVARHLALSLFPKD